MTKIGTILDEFFSPFSSEKLWTMGPVDDYTSRVRAWQPVINGVNRIKANLALLPSVWQASFRTDTSWKPSKTDAPKPGAYRDFSASPPGTDPETCKSAFVVYVASKAVAGGILPEIQTDKLYTCSIGSFNIYTTVDVIDVTAKTATLNYWMYNAMSKRSFGHFATLPVFALCGMKTQYMWWNWGENVEWTTGSVVTVPGSGGGGW
jgi:hypothetical protein